MLCASVPSALAMKTSEFVSPTIRRNTSRLPSGEKFG